MTKELKKEYKETFRSQMSSDDIDRTYCIGWEAMEMKIDNLTARASQEGAKRENNRCVDVINQEIKEIKQRNHVTDNTPITLQHIQSDYGQTILELEAIVLALQDKPLTTQQAKKEL